MLQRHLGVTSILKGVLGEGRRRGSLSMGGLSDDLGERMERHFWDRTSKYVKEQSLLRKDNEARGGG